MKNPFPGMNPWLEEFWRDVHAKLIVYACDQLNGELPAGLHARVDERIAIDAEAGEARHYLPDVAVTESWDRPAGPVFGLACIAGHDRLSLTRVPLRRTAPDAVLDLQGLIDQCYERGRYATAIDYGTTPDPLLPPDEIAWANAILKPTAK